MFFDYGDLRLHYETFGEGEPMLMVHGMGCDLRLMTDCMEPVFASLGERASWRRVYMDLPGMGRSNAPLDFASADRVLEALLAFADAEAGKRFALVGESYGGYLSRGILAKRPDAVTGLMLICPVVKPDRFERDLPGQVARFDDPTYLDSLTPQDRQRFTDAFVIADARTHRRYIDALRNGVERADRAFLHALSQHYALSFDVDAAIAAAGFDRPSLIVAGHQDHTVGFHDAMRLLDAYPRATFALLDEAGHNAQIERDALFGALARDWLQRMAGPLASRP
ncbi:alpha/beta fold hydrolase [Bifidobacterium cuniculi]|uniref:2-hydroxy-6-oxo-6-phenylhexa-2,4-dienoate hydrolase n=1 Tax=Bifidobacterium cuniculi TaxID=1688 RepID=A0A087AT27_9BIFI|nr:alpha/beta hydrolase [Bifidobacterium cuniculi]KFI61927.1 2-hydroxy-6-oxo-6-phenylhexa-2,4-dienoate hydrolase [Bifidobacterium cuniculi]